MTAALNSEVLIKALNRHLGAKGIHDLRRLSGGASQEIWAFTAYGGPFSAPEPMVLRRAPVGLARTNETSLPLDVEAELQVRAAAAGIPVAKIRFVLNLEDGLGHGYVMSHVAGETIPRKILRDPEFAQARKKLAAQCGAVLGRLHQVEAANLPLKPFGADEQLAKYQAIYQRFHDCRPVFDWAFHWLARHLPKTDPAPAQLVHGDFRNGNLMVGPDGLRAILDWELAHIGDGHEDLGWICVNSWRFGEVDHPVGGFGAREDLFLAYQAAGGGPVDESRVRFWEIFGTLKWGIMCMISCAAHLSGQDRSVERAAIGRRVSETELDLVNLIAGDIK